MMFLRPLARTILLAATTVAVALAAVHLARMPVEIGPRSIEAPVLQLAHPAPAGPAGQPGIGGTDMLARPLFSPSRRPYVAPVAVPAFVPEPPPLQEETRQEPGGTISVIGIFLDGADRQALLVSPSFPEGKWFSIDADLDGWKLARIEADSVQLAGPQGSLSLPLYVDNNNSP
jgi:hypothetical protein